LIPYLLRDAEDDQGLCHEFFTEAVSRFDEDDSIKFVLVNAMAGLSSQLSQMDMNGNYKPYVQVSNLHLCLPCHIAEIVYHPGSKEFLPISCIGQRVGRSSHLPTSAINPSY
jgi:ubiquitin conjugation factor E4 B